MTVAQAFVKLFGMLNTLLSLVGLVQGSTAKAAQENVPFHIDTVTSETWALASDSAVGLAAIKAELLIIDAHIASVDSSLAAAIAGVQLSTLPVILPTTPPSGYGGSSSSVIAADVWGFVLFAGQDANSALGEAWQTVTNTIGKNGIVVPGRLWQAAIDNQNFSTSNSDNSGPFGLIDETTILPTDATILAWLQRVYSTWGWVSSYRDGNAGAVYPDPNNTSSWWICTMSQSEFTGFKGTVSSVLVPPIWPGLAFATLGTPVALSVGLTITEPMDGAIVSLTSEPAKAGFFTFDDVNSYRNLGALSFFDDDNNQEAPQSLGFSSAAYCPKTMVRAAGVKVRCVGGVTGTITPWVIA